MAFSRSNIPTYASFSELLGNGREFSVPPFQRDYSWREENWQELWRDILEIDEKREEEHFLGPIVLRQSGRPGANEATIIDGQQRLATLSILSLAAVSILDELATGGIEPDANRERARTIREALLSSRDPISLHYSSKLALNRADNDFYRGTLLQLRAPHAPSRLSSSNGLLWQAFLFMKARIKERFPSDGDGGPIALFVLNTVASRLFFLRIPVEDEMAAYTVFETFNARGVELTASDLLKNYLMSRVAPLGEADLRQVMIQWEEIVRAVSTKALPEFLRHYVNSTRKPFVRKERLFRTIRESVNRPEDAFQLLDELVKAAQWYQALDDETDAQWYGVPRAPEFVWQLKLFGVRQYKPLALATARKFSPTDLGEVLRFCTCISFRYNIIADKNPGDLESVYNEVAADIESGVITNLQQVRARLRPVALSDDEFRDAFSRKVLPASGRGRRLVRYILCRLEQQLGNVAISDESKNLTIEHILPENLTPEWEQTFDPDRHQRYVHRLGNVTLLTPSQNRDVGQKTISEKAAVYRDSEFWMTKRLDVVDWEPRDIERRQHEMAAWASPIWSL